MVEKALSKSFLDKSELTKELPETIKEMKSKSRLIELGFLRFSQKKEKFMITKTGSKIFKEAMQALKTKIESDFIQVISSFLIKKYQITLLDNEILDFVLYARRKK